MARCIVVSGRPCAGKSSLARLLAARYGVPLLAKDDYKDRVFRRLGARDRDWSRQVSLLAWDLLLDQAATLVGAGVDCLLEGNFREPEARALRRLGAAAAAQFVEIRCLAAPTVLLARYRARAVAGTRHPGHVDLEALPELERELALPATPLALGGPLLAWDTSGGFDERPVTAWLDGLAAAG